MVSDFLIILHFLFQFSRSQLMSQLLPITCKDMPSGSEGVCLLLRYVPLALVLVYSSFTLNIYLFVFLLFSYYIIYYIIYYNTVIYVCYRMVLYTSLKRKIMVIWCMHTRTHISQIILMRNAVSVGAIIINGDVINFSIIFLCTCSNEFFKTTLYNAEIS